MKKICLIGAFDTKGPEFAFLHEQILARGHEVLTVNTGVMGSTDLFLVDVEADKVAEAGGGRLTDSDFNTHRGILSTASGSRWRCNPDGLCERGHFKGAAEAVAEIGEGAYAQLLRCLHQRCEDVHRTGASLATAV